MIHRTTRRFIFQALLFASVSSLIASFIWIRSMREREMSLQLASFNNQLATFDSSLGQLAAFLTEPGDIADDGHIVRRLNRFVYGNNGILGVELITRKGTYRNSNASSGEYVNGGLVLPSCRGALTDGANPSRLLRSCGSGELSVERRFESFDGTQVILRLVLQPRNLPGGAAIGVGRGLTSERIACGSSDAPNEVCFVRATEKFSGNILRPVVPFFAFCFLAALLVAFIFFRLVIVPLRTLNRLILQTRELEVAPSEMSLSRLGILRLFRQPVVAITDLVRQKSELERKSAEGQARVQIADEVVHNIQSPLATLHGIEPDMGSVPEDARVAFRSAVGRIGDIVNLLQKDVGPTGVEGHPETHLVSSLIAALLSEKRRQFFGRQGLTLEFESSAASYGIFVKLDGTAFKTVLSNLINNAVEAIPQTKEGRVAITLRSRGLETCELEIVDNGTGMAPEVLARATMPGFTFGKAHGRGVGLSHAKSTVESWGGRLEVRSLPNQGTRIVLTLRRSRAPQWFLPNLDIAKGSAVAVLDDERSIHHLWKSRIGSDCVLRHFHGGDDLRQAAQIGAKFDHILADYELLGEPLTGLELIAQLGLTARTILVTSRFEDPALRSECERFGLKLLPKGLAGLVPISIVERPTDSPDAIFLDDDPLLRQTWQKSAQRAGIRLSVFSNPDELLCSVDRLPRGTPIYVDFKLGGNLNGLEVCERLHQAGFTRLFLSTGARIENAPYWLVTVGKNPPFTINRDDSLTSS